MTVRGSSIWGHEYMGLLPPGAGAARGSLLPYNASAPRAASKDACTNASIQKIVQVVYRPIVSSLPIGHFRRLVHRYAPMRPSEIPQLSIFPDAAFEKSVGGCYSFDF